MQGLPNGANRKLTGAGKSSRGGRTGWGGKVDQGNRDWANQDWEIVMVVPTCTVSSDIKDTGPCWPISDTATYSWAKGHIWPYSEKMSSS